MAYTRTRDWATVDFYATLGVDADASDEEIARAFRALAKQFHPDVGAPVEHARRFTEISLAYDVLGNPRSRRDYDAVRAGLLPRTIRARPAQPVPASQSETEAAPRFRGSEPRAKGWTRRRAWFAFVGGMLVLLLGIGVSFFVIRLQHDDAADRAGRVATTAQRLTVGGRDEIRFTTRSGAVVRTKAPNQVNPSTRGTTLAVLYDPHHPTDVIADESYVARDITLWIVAIKLLIGGPVFAILGWRALQRQRRSSATPT